VDVILRVDDKLDVLDPERLAQQLIAQCCAVVKQRWGLDVTRWDTKIWLSRLFATARFARSEGGELLCKIVAYDPSTGEISEMKWELR